MEWTVPTRNIVNKEIGKYWYKVNIFLHRRFAVIPWNDKWASKAKDTIWRKLGGPVFLDGKNQIRDFPLFLGKVQTSNVAVKLISLPF
jgi:hypothetical protein